MDGRRKRKKKPRPAGVEVLAKLLRILEAIHASPSALTLKPISEAAAVNKSTAYRFLTHLEREGYLVRTAAGAYLVGPKLERFGASRTAEPQVETGGEPFPPGETRS